MSEYTKELVIGSTIINGTKKVVGKIADIGLARVYVVEDTRPGYRGDRKSVLKVPKKMHEGAKIRFGLECKTTSNLSGHPLFVRYISEGEEEFGQYLEVALIPGEDLELYLNERDKLTQMQGLGVSLQIARAMEHAHSRDIVLVDVKPGNIMITGQGLVGMIDHGLARDINVFEAEYPLLFQNEEGRRVGTPVIYSPETANCGRPTKLSDVFALGVNLYRIGTNDWPFRGEVGPFAIPGVHIDTIRKPRRHNPEISEELEELILATLEKDPKNRPQSARKVANRLQALLRKEKEREREQEKEK